MGTIYKEGIRYKKISFARWVILLVLTLLTVNLLLNGRYYSSRYNIEVEFVLIAGGLFAAYLLKKVYDFSYVHGISFTYKLIDKELIFERATMFGSRVILNIDAKYIELLEPAYKVKYFRNVDRVYKFLCCPLRNSLVYCCVVNNNGQKVKIYFQPSAELVKKLKMISSINRNLEKIS